MAGETVITVVGNLTADPELKFIHSGDAVANFTVASTPRTYDRQSGQWVDGEPLFMRCNAWKQLAENISESFQRGNRVIVQGRLKQRSFETREGEKRTVMELEVDEIGASAKFAVVSSRKADRGSQGGQQQSGGQQQGGGGRAWGGRQGGQQQQGGQQSSPGAPWRVSGQQQQGGGQQQQSGDPWASAPAGGGGGTQGYDDEPPF